MKLKVKKKVIGKKKQQLLIKKAEAEDSLPLAYQTSGARAPTGYSSSEEDEEDKKRQLAMSDAFDAPDEDDDEPAHSKLAKLDAKDELGHIDIKLPPPEGPAVAATAGAVDGGATESQQQQTYRKFDRTVTGPERALALHQGSAAALAFQNIRKVPEARVLYGDQTQVSISTTTTGIGNPTFFTEYNLPCCLRRCKFPKEQV
jgi:hypothetical protein